ncbi:MAG TPA: NADPH-dependent F420 reductase [Dehalococcoidia bacterium]|nr:NADPH-dependent F420 reductase [Dehalococcoidia bacterium]
MKIAVVGTGNVGGTLGRRWAGNGHQVVFCSRTPDSDRVKALVDAAGPNARAAGINEGVAASDVVVFATPWPGTLDLVGAAGSLQGKVVVDCTNPLRPDLSGLSIDGDTSGAEQIAQRAKGAAVVKAFNTISSLTMADPLFGSERADLFLCGDDAGAKRTVAQLGQELGFEPVDAGPLRAARYLEYLAMLWVHMAYKQNWGPNFIFKTVRR